VGHLNLLESIRVAAQSLKANKLRSALTMLGLIIGVGAVVALVSIGSGASQSITQEVQGLGSNLVVIMPGSEEETMQGMMTSYDPTVLKLGDADAIEKKAKYINGVTPILYRPATIWYKGKSKTTYVYGTYETAVELINYPIEIGHNFTRSDIKSAARVAIIGQTLQKDLFGTENPIGKIVRINNQNFRILGVIEKRGTDMFGIDRDNQIGMPITTAAKKLFGENYVDEIIAQVKSEDFTDKAIDEIKQILRREHHLSKNEKADFIVTSMAQLLDIMSTITSILTILLGSIAGISMLVGGIGIMNIMLVSVTERTREIGIRKAIGAKRRDILLQFLVESTILSLFGGSLGILIGVSLAKLVSIAGNLPTAVTAGSIFLAFGFSVGVGLFFGMYPAFRAAKLHPIEALRYE
jgi:putative ABC transport system permease protein